MKFAMAFLLIFTVLADFSVASYDIDTCHTTSEEASICTDAHLEDSEANNHEESSGTHACHNHAGHSHIAIFPELYSDLKSSATELSIKFPNYTVQNINLYLNEISRPPIS